MPLTPIGALARRDDLFISDDPALVDLDVVHGFLTTSYWSPGIPREIVRRAIEHSMVFGVYTDTPPRPVQIGFARVITDRATFAYLADVFILEPHRGRGLSKWLMETILAHPHLRGLRRISLMTRDAQGLYTRFGFRPIPDPSRYMEIAVPNIYLRDQPPAP
ncbi:MAG: GNAT family N-acetyltransferase [Phycisphaerales bacterium]